jgi:hypothetical protein
LLREGFITVCAGGGGIPVALDSKTDGGRSRRHGVEAVIDKVTHILTFVIRMPDAEVVGLGFQPLNPRSIIWEADIFPGGGHRETVH